MMIEYETQIIFVVGLVFLYKIAGLVENQVFPFYFGFIHGLPIGADDLAGFGDLCSAVILLHVQCDSTGQIGYRDGLDYFNEFAFGREDYGVVLFGFTTPIG